MNREDLYDTFFNIVNNVKNTAFSSEIIDPDSHLSGELGIDSRELLEIWYEAELKLNIKVPDYEKRDLYTVEDVVMLIESKLLLAVAN